MGLWRRAEETARRVAAIYGYEEIRTPIFERTELFVRGVGRSTDIVRKEMYSFKDRAGRDLTLRPEGTAPVIRAYIENSLGKREGFVKLFYIGPLFRYEKPQAGRFRQHHQFGVEAIGSFHPALDAEVIEMLMRFYEELGIGGLTVGLNSVGCPECRPAYNAELKSYLARRLGDLCEDCRRRTETNPLRVFDCKRETCARAITDAPRIPDSLCSGCAEHLASVRGMLDEAGVNYRMKSELVRGLDYYTRTTFEVYSDRLGAQNAVGGGGRYDGLVGMLGGDPTPAIGFGVGLERVVMLMGEGNAPAPPCAAVFVAVWEDECMGRAREIVRDMRRAGIAAEMGFERRSLRSQLRRANRSGARLVVIMGRDELARGMARVKSMESGEEREVALGDVVSAAGEVIEGTS